MSPMVSKPSYDDRLKDYVDVRERIRLFYERFPDGRLVTSRVKASADPDGVPRVWVEARAYRTGDDDLPGVGWSWMVLPGTTPYTNGSELENTETSAWGRAIGALGIGIDKGIASAQEVRNKSGEDEREGDGSLIGTVTRGKAPVDYDLRYGPDGIGAAGFKLAHGRQGLQVLALGDLAEALATLLPSIEGQTVTVWGTVQLIDWQRDGKAMPPYRRLILERIQTPDWTLPAPDHVEAMPIPLPLDEDERALVGGGLP